MKKLLLLTTALLACQAEHVDRSRDQEPTMLRVERITSSLIEASYESYVVGRIDLIATTDGRTIESEVLFEEIDLALSLSLPHFRDNQIEGIEEMIEAEAATIAATGQLDGAVLDEYEKANLALFTATNWLGTEPIRFVFHYHSSVLATADRMMRAPRSAQYEEACMASSLYEMEQGIFQCEEDLPPTDPAEGEQGVFFPGCSGSSIGCCGNYSGFCWYSDSKCFAHDVACWDCQNPIVPCGPGCVPETGSLEDGLQNACRTF